MIKMCTIEDLNKLIPAKTYELKESAGKNSRVRRRKLRSRVK